MTSLGSLHHKPGSFGIILDVCISPYLPRFQVPEIKIEALSISKNFYHQSGMDVEAKISFCVESHIFAGEEIDSK